MGTDKDLTTKEAISKMKGLAEDIKIGILLTHLDQIPVSGRPMTTKEVDEEGNIWFLGTTESDYYKHIQDDNRIQLIYSHPDDIRFLSVYGKITIEHNPVKVDELWSKLDNAWFEKGKEDPTLILLRVNAREGHYWDTESGKLVNFLKIASASITGNEVNSGTQGDLNLS